MRVLNLLVCCLVIPFTVGVQFAYAEISSKGNDFLFAFQPNIKDKGELSLFITGEEDTTGVVQISGLNFVANFDVVANEITKVDLPNSAQVSLQDQITNLGVRVNTQKDVTIYGFNRFDYSTDAFLAIPVNSLGTEYFVSSYQATASYIPSQMIVVGVYDNTEITITHSAPISGKFGFPVGIPFTISLNSNETYALETSGSFTGSLVESSAPVAVLSGGECALIQGINPCDHIVEMMPPVSALGKSFMFRELAGRGKSDTIGIVATEDNTQVNIIGKDNIVPNETFTLNRGEDKFKGFYGQIEVYASAPILLTRYSPSLRFDGAKLGDPFMMLGVPTEQFLNNYSFTSLDVDAFRKHYINVVALTNSFNTIVLDGVALDSNFQDFDQTGPLPIGSSGYSGAQIVVSAGSHNISSSTPFGLYVYGHGVAESYGYPGGMKLERINPPADSFSPNVRLNQFGFSIQGIASDDEDSNLNGILDAGEDINANGILDVRTEDLNGNGVLDEGEDTNDNGKLDSDSGIYKIELEDGADNFLLTVNSLVPGSAKTNFTITLIDPNGVTSGNIIVTDGGGNVIKKTISFETLSLINGAKVISVLSTIDIDLDQTSFSIEPDQITITDDKTFIEWNYGKIEIGQIETISYDVVLRNLQPGEVRLVTHKVNLSYVDINGEEIKTELPQQDIVVRSSVFDLNVQTERDIYTENETVLSSVVLANLGISAVTTNLNVNVVDNGGAIIENIGEFSQFSISSGESIKLDLSAFNTGVLYKGEYMIRADLLSDSGDVIETTTTPFSIVSSIDTSIGLYVNTDKISYLHLDTVQLTTRIDNLTDNVPVEGFVSKTTIYSPDGSVYWMRTNQVSQILPGNFTNLFYSVDLAQALPGQYRVETVVETKLGAVEIIDNALFTVMSTAETAIGLSGNVEISDNPVFRSQLVNLTSSIKNTGNAPVSNGTLVLSVINPDSETILDEWIITNVDIALGQDFIFDQEYTINVNGGSKYLVVLSFETLHGLKLLAQQSFNVEESINVDFALSEGARLLVLVDGVNQANGYINDPLGPIDTPNASQQRLKLEQILNATGWTYTIADDADTFASELRSGGYTTYAFFSEQIKLDNQLLKELRESIYSGEGLLVSGSHDSRNSEILDILGIKVTGSETITSGIDLVAEEPYVSGTSYVHNDIKAQRTQAVDTNIIGTFQSGNKNDVAVTQGLYGDGKSAYIGFDLLLQATLNDSDPFFEQLLTSALADIRPNAVNLSTQEVVPLSLLLVNDGGAKLGQAAITLPLGLEVISTSESTQIINNQIIWPFSLGTDDSKALRIWIRLPELPKDINITAQVQLGVSPNLSDFTTMTATMSVQATYDLVDVWNNIKGLATEKDFKIAAKYIEDALNSQRSGDYSRSLSLVIKASDELLIINTDQAMDLREKLAVAIQGIQIKL